MLRTFEVFRHCLLDPHSLVGVSGETLASLTRNNIALLIDADAIVIETV